MIYLSRLILNPRSRQVQSELARPYEMHRTLMQGFPDGVRREDANLLHRLDTNPRGGVHNGNLTLLIQSTLEPDWASLLEAGQGHYLLSPPQCKQVNLDLPAGTTLKFRLVANPTVKKKRKGKKHSNRVPLVREEHQIEWLKRKGELHGFAPLHTYIRSLGEQTNRKRKLTIFKAQFDGLLQITAAEDFTQALQTGIGPARAFGCGLLSLAPA